jgi:ring-1,2-phenylacetyl-CoA epoxidase subunit PaaC
VSDELVSLLTALADDELVIGHRHSEWTGYAPHIEEDVAFSSIAQDEIGHATAYYSLAARLVGTDADRLALGREKAEYRNAILCERPNHDWAFTLARQWLYDTADEVRLSSLADTADVELRALVIKIRREERYHLMHAELWMNRVARGPVEGRRKLVDAVAAAYPDALGLFEEIDLEEKAVHEGLLPVPSAELRKRFATLAVERLDALGLPSEVHSHAGDSAEFVASSSGDLIESAGRSSGDDERHEASLGGRRGRHSRDFDELWRIMTSQYQDNPGATW